MSEQDVNQILATAEQVVKLREAAVKTWNALLSLFEKHMDSLPGNPEYKPATSALVSPDPREAFPKDFAAQRSRLKEHARGLSATPDKSIAILERILEKGTEFSGRDTFRYHPSVILASKNEILALVKAARKVFLA